MDLVGSGSGLILRYYPGILLKGLRKTRKTSIKIVVCRGRDFNPGPPEYESHRTDFVFILTVAAW
jgi:hypothetical protein